MALAESQRRSRMEVPLLDLKLQYQALRGEIEAALQEVCAGQAFILGPAVKALERQENGLRERYTAMQRELSEQLQAAGLAGGGGGGGRAPSDAE